MAPRDQFPSRSAGAAPRQYFAVTPSDTVDLAQIPQAIWIGSAGNLAVVGGDGNSVVFQSLAAGQYWIGAPSRVLATGTTATNLIGVV